MLEPMKIAVTADPMLPVPPKEYGGIERIVDLLVRGLTDRGHTVTLFAHPDSRVPCRLVKYPRQSDRSIVETARISLAVASEIYRGQYDCVHSFGRLAYLTPILPLRVPKLMTYQREITVQSVARANRLARGSLKFSAISDRMLMDRALEGDWRLVYNGVSEIQYDFRERVTRDAPLIFLGRIEPIKGVHLAIEVARESGRRLTIAGNIPAGSEHQRYFDDEIAPHLDDDRIRYVGPVDDETKNAILGGSAAMLMPIQWEEPFGIVMAEALACGTPVIGLARGSVPEIVRHGVDGFVCNTVAEMVHAAGRLEEIDRANCRRSMEERFSARGMVDAYEAIYAELVKGRTSSADHTSGANAWGG